jgi:GMP synthase (glutamine-hydrolysing)
MRILSIVHADSDPPGLFAQVASELGHEHDEWRADLRPEPPSEPDTYAAVAVFGGYMSPSDDDRLGWLRTEKGVLGHLVERQVPSLGICLGAQLLAEAAGAKIHPADPPEIGWSEIEVLPQHDEDALFGGLTSRLTVFEWHSWTFGLPIGAVALARSSGCLQAYRLEPATWGIQFHAEVTPDKLFEWLDHAAIDAVAKRIGVDPARQREASRRHLPASMDLGRRLFTRFLERVADHGTAATDARGRVR